MGLNDKLKDILRKNADDFYELKCDTNDKFNDIKKLLIPEKNPSIKVLSEYFPTYDFKKIISKPVVIKKKYKNHNIEYSIFLEENPKLYVCVNEVSFLYNFHNNRYFVDILKKKRLFKKDIYYLNFDSYKDFSYLSYRMWSLHSLDDLKQMNRILTTAISLIKENKIAEEIYDKILEFFENLNKQF